MTKSRIEWTDRVWNPVTGCTKVSQGCKNCYAETMAKRFWGERKFGDVQCHSDRLTQPLSWRKPSMVFVNSMSDLFHEDVSFLFIDHVFDHIEASGKHVFQILTKRPSRALEFFAWKSKQNGYRFENWPLPNVWIGVSVEDQKTADERIPLLLLIPAAVRFVSCEPLLEPIDFNSIEGKYTAMWHGLIHWVICGGESGSNARPMHPDWARSLRDQCQSADVPFFFKQWGEWVPLEGDWGIRANPEATGWKFRDGGKNTVVGDFIRFGSFHTRYATTENIDVNTRADFVKVGKAKSGRLLDGREWNGLPASASLSHPPVEPPTPVERSRNERSRSGSRNENEKGGRS